MNLVPNYQIIDFLDWLKYRHEYRQQDIDLESYDFVELAKNYLYNDSFDYGKFDFKLILKNFQTCPKIREENILREMEHFTQCGHCIKYLDKENYSRKLKGLKLHPLLDEFLYYLDEKDFYFHNNDRSVGFNSDIYKDELRDVFNRWIRNNGQHLLAEFRAFIEKTDKKNNY